MSRTGSRATIALVLAFPCSIAAADEPVLEGPTLQQKLVELDSLRNGRDTPFAKAEERGRELLAQYKTPGEQADIQFIMTQVYGQSGIDRTFERVRHHARLALGLERDPVRRATLHTYLGSAAEVDSTVRAFEDRRRQATLEYLEGYKEILAIRLPEVAPELPAVMRFDIDGGPEEIEDARREHEAQMRARREAEFAREMVHHRHVLVGQVAQLYRRPPRADGEPEALARRVLEKPRDIEEFLTRVARWEAP